MVVDTMELPPLQDGQVLVKTLHCGICGSDLHAVHHFESFIDYGRRAGLLTGRIDPRQDVVLGHEFCAEIVEFGPKTEQTLKVGANVGAFALNFDDRGAEGVGWSNRYPGGYAEYMILTESMLLPVTNGCPSERAAMTEPMSVAVHAVNKADHADSVYMIVGCGPIGLAIVAELKSRGLGPVVAVDFVAERRAVAEVLGADMIIDPAQENPHEQWARLGVPYGPVVYPRTQSSARRGIIFECVGAPGMLGKLIEVAPRTAQLIIAGVCMAPDTIEPSMAINKELELKFAMAFSADEFRQTMHRICEGELDVTPMISEVIGLDEVPQMFDTLLNNPHAAKVIVDPRR
jgi:threonine dehydrogenase-like Zn-dependent dehydrogenase